MAGWRHQNSGLELGQTPGDGEGQGGLLCCSPWGLKEADMSGRLNRSDVFDACVCLYGFILIFPGERIFATLHLEGKERRGGENRGEGELVRKDNLVIYLWFISAKGPLQRL